jgi:hypothetical protein
MEMLTRTVAFAIGKPALAVLLGAVVLWQCAASTGIAKARAVIFVSNVPADLVVDREVFRVEDLRRNPIVCHLRPGQHSARLVQNGRVVYQQEFLVGAGEKVVFEAGDGYKDMRSQIRGERSSTALLWPEP